MLKVPISWPLNTYCEFCTLFRGGGGPKSLSGKIPDFVAGILLWGILSGEILSWGILSWGILSRGSLSFSIFRTHKIWGILSGGILSQVNFSPGDFVMGDFVAGGFCHGGFWPSTDIYCSGFTRHSLKRYPKNWRFLEISKFSEILSPRDKIGDLQFFGIFFGDQIWRHFLWWGTFLATGIKCFIIVYYQGPILKYMSLGIPTPAPPSDFCSRILL